MAGAELAPKWQASRESADQTAVRTEGIAERFRWHPKAKAEVDEG